MKNQTSPLYMRIRHYVFDWLAGTRGGVVRLPSNRELAEKFGVSQPTVVRAFQDLIKEGYLTNRPGVGLFSNPTRIAMRESKIWGIVFGDGRWAYVSRDAFHVAGLIGGELLERDNHNLLKLITMGEVQSQMEFPELSMLSGICCWCAENEIIPDLRRISESVPVVVIGGGNLTGLDCYYFNFEQENYEIARWMISRGCRRLAIVSDRKQEGARSGVQQACKEAGFDFLPSYVLGDDITAEQELEKMVSLGCAPDGIIFNCKAAGFSKVIKRHRELDHCLIASDPLWVDRTWDFDGLLFHTHYEGIVGEVVDLLEKNADEMPRTARQLPVFHEFVSKNGPQQNRRVKHEMPPLYVD